MERLTVRRDNDNQVCLNIKDRDVLTQWGDYLQRVCDKLAAYEEAEEQGLFVILPVKSGDTVYQLRDKKHALCVGVHPRHISCVCVYGNDWTAEHQGDKPCTKNDFGKTWFLTREEAEAALKGERKDV